MFSISAKLTGGFVAVSASALVLALQACGGGGGGSGSAVAPTTSTPATATPIATATPTTAPPTSTPTPVASVTPGPVTASWAGINGYNATSPPNFVPTFAAPLSSGFVGENGPPIVFTAIGQTVHVTITQANSLGTTPSSVGVVCNSVVGTLAVANAINGPTSGGFDLSLAKTTAASSVCNVQITGSIGFNFGNYFGSFEVLNVNGP